MNLLGLAEALEIAAAVSALLLATRRARHVPAAVALGLLAMVPLVRGAIAAAGHRPMPLLAVVDVAAELGALLAVPALALSMTVRAEHRRRAVAGAVVVWALGVTAIGLSSPSPFVTTVGLARIYIAVDFVGLFVAIGALLGWAERVLAAKASVASAPLVALALVILDGSILLAPMSPWRGAPFGRDFSGVQVIVSVFAAAVTAAQVTLWKFSPG